MASYANVYIMSPSGDGVFAFTTSQLVAQFIHVKSWLISPDPVTVLMALQKWSKDQFISNSLNLITRHPEPPRHEVCFVITEFLQPDMSYYKFLDSIRAIPNSKYIHVMVMDSVYDHERKQRCLAKGARYFAKPMNARKMECLRHEFIKQELFRIQVDHRQRREDIFTHMIIISPTSEPVLIDVCTSYLLQNFPHSSKFVEETGAATISTIQEIFKPYPDQPPLGQERVLIITEFNLGDMCCYEFLERVKQIACPAYVHVAVVDLNYASTRLLRCNQGGAHYYRQPISASQMHQFKVQILRKEARIEEADR